MLDPPNPNGRREADKPQVTDEAFLKKHGYPRTDPTYANVEMLQYLCSFVPKKGLKFLAGIFSIHSQF